MAESHVLKREARAIGGERADESQQVQSEVHPERSRGAIGGARPALGVESKTRVELLFSMADGVFGRDKRQELLASHLLERERTSVFLDTTKPPHQVCNGRPW